VKTILFDDHNVGAPLSHPAPGDPFDDAPSQPTFGVADLRLWTSTGATGNTHVVWTASFDGAPDVVLRDEVVDFRLGVGVVNIFVQNYAETTTAPAGPGAVAFQEWTLSAPCP
jgi:hypothetical protein